MHKLLQRQIKKNLHNLDNSKELLQEEVFLDFLTKISKAYDHRDMECRLLERTIDLSSQELNAANELLKKQNEEISELATTDALTGLPNRHVFDDRIKQALERGKRFTRFFSTLFIDLDRFKTINDTLGHHIGDLLLQQVAQRLLTCVRKCDTVARMGGDEFMILADELRNAKDAIKVAQKVLDKLARPFILEEHELMITASIGISTYPADGQDLVSLVKNADTAMYRAKEIGRNNFQLYCSLMTDKAMKKMAIESRLHRALERKELSLHYQPKVDLRSSKLIGFEALIRWYNPDIGQISPAEFIPLAEETGLILPIGNWVLHTACQQIKDWQEQGYDPVPVAVNISARQIQQPNFVEGIAKVLHETSVSPRLLELELTEGIVMHQAELTVNLLHQLKDMKIMLSIDDFGTGYSSLSYLKRFPIDTLKIDQSFIRDIDIDPDNAAITKAIIAMSHSLKLNVIAEGVETKKQMIFLMQEQCNQAQGYLFGKPSVAEEAAHLLEQSKFLDG